jgi:hypothetical protein
VKKVDLSDLSEELTRIVADKGRLMGVGYMTFAAMFVDENTPAKTRRRMEVAFLMGAQHVWASIMNMLDEGAEPTDADLRRMDMLGREMDIVTEHLLPLVSAKARSADEQGKKGN